LDVALGPGDTFLSRRDVIAGASSVVTFGFTSVSGAGSGTLAYHVPQLITALPSAKKQPRWGGGEIRHSCFEHDGRVRRQGFAELHSLLPRSPQEVRLREKGAICRDIPFRARAVWRKKEMKTCLRVMGIGVLAISAVVAQRTDTRFPVRGELSGGPVGALTVELTPTGSGSTQRAMVSGDGTFEVPSLESGFYELRVVNSGGAVLHTEIVNVAGPRQVLSIRIPEPSASASAAGSAQGPVSVRQLMHKAPPQAQKAFEKGQQAENKGNHQQAAEFFQQAVSIDPEYADAYNELGAVQARQNYFPQAIQSLQKAIDLVPDHPMAIANMSIVLAKAGRYEEATVAARRALRFNPASSSVRYILATCLMQVKGESDEVLDNLERSAPEIPFAHMLAAEILAHRGKREEAARHVEEYLRAIPPDDKHRSRAEAMLAQLRS
jgi:Flp pilus assembly protein TadD